LIVNQGAQLTLDEVTTTNGYNSILVNGGSLVAVNSVISYSEYGISGSGVLATLTTCNLVGNSYGISVSGNSEVDLNTCQITNSNGQGISCTGSQVNDDGSTYSGNTGSYGAAINANGCSFSMTSVTFSNNINNYPSNGQGAGIYFTSSSFFVSDSTFFNNTGAYDGGAFYCGSSSTLNIFSSTISNNQAVIAGAGDCASSCSMICSNCVLSNNSGKGGSCNFSKSVRIN